jgi:hypothetical protein
MKVFFKKAWMQVKRVFFMIMEKKIWAVLASVLDGK